MKVLVCGGRAYANRGLVFGTLDKLAPRPTLIISGHAGHPLRDAKGKTLRDEDGDPIEVGADRIAEAWAKANGVPCHTYAARWRDASGRLDTSAGPRRNQTMLDEEKPDLVVAFPGGRGTADMTTKAKAAGINVLTVRNRSNHDQARRAKERP